jgi:hypothetical protein
MVPYLFIAALLAASPRRLEHPLPTGSLSKWHSFTGASRVAAEGNVVWVAANEGLRRYDFNARTLSRPRGVPAGTCTAVVAAKGKVWAAVDGTLYERDRKESWLRDPHLSFGEVAFLATDGEALWLASSTGLWVQSATGRWESISATLGGLKLDGAGMVSTSGGVTWAWMFGKGTDGYRAALVRIRAGKVEAYDHPNPSKHMLMPSLLAAMPDGTARLGFYGSQGDRVEGGPLFSFDGKAWVKISLPGDPQAISGTADGSTLWVSTAAGIVRVPPEGKLDAPFGLPEAGQGGFEGAVVTNVGLIVLDSFHLRRKQGNHWTLFTAPVRGISTEKSGAAEDGWYPATGFSFAPGRDPVGPRPARETQAWPKTGEIAGIPIHDARGANGHELSSIEGLFAEESQTDWWAWRAELSPADVFRIRGVYRERERMPPSISAARSDAGVIGLTAPIPGAVDSIVEAIVRPVLRRDSSHANHGDEVTVLFEPVAPPVLLSTRKARSAVEAFHRAHQPAGLPPDASFYLRADEPTGNVVLSAEKGGFFVTSIDYVVSLDGTLRSIWIRRWLKGE